MLYFQVILPPEISSLASAMPGSQGNQSENIRLIMTVFETPSLFISQQVLNFSQENKGVNRSANTPVISFSIGGTTVKNLSQPINLTFAALQVNTTD